MKALQENIPLAPWTTFGIGGPARYFLDATSARDLVDGFDFAETRQLPVFILGGGSNLLVADRGFPGLVLRVSIPGLTWEGNQLLAGAGEVWDDVVAACVERGLAGVECLSGIPGLAGGTPVQNVGAYGQEAAETIASVRVLDRRTGVSLDLPRERCGFAYRTSIFNSVEKQRYVILAVRYVLTPNGQPRIEYPDLLKRFPAQAGFPSLAEVRRVVREVRQSKGMLLVEGDPDCRSAGSFFKNPLLTESEYETLQHGVAERVPRYPAAAGHIKTSAAWLIERAGFPRGFARGPAAVSGKHTLALVNRGGATAADLLGLAREIRCGVEERFGVRLQAEPVLVGFEEGERL